MEDQGERSPQTFLVDNYSFLQLWQKQDNWCTFKWVLNADRRFKAAAWTLENKHGNVQYKFEVESGNWKPLVHVFAWKVTNP